MAYNFKKCLIAFRLHVSVSYIFRAKGRNSALFFPLIFIS